MEIRRNRPQSNVPLAPFDIFVRGHRWNLRSQLQTVIRSIPAR